MLESFFPPIQLPLNRPPPTHPHPHSQPPPPCVNFMNCNCKGILGHKNRLYEQATTDQLLIGGKEDIILPGEHTSNGLPGPYLAGGGGQGARAVPSGGGGQGGSCPPVIRKKCPFCEQVPFLRAGALFLIPNHQQQQGAPLNLGLPPPPSHFRLCTAMVARKCWPARQPTCSLEATSRRLPSRRRWWLPGSLVYSNMQN